MLRSRYSLAVFALALAACWPSRPLGRGLKSGDTQVVVQWVLPAKIGIFGLQRYFRAEQRIAKAGSEIYFDDGNDVGRGKLNVFLYTDQVDKTVALLIQLEKDGTLPPGFRVGVAVYERGIRTDWTYRVAYPENRTSFNLN